MGAPTVYRWDDPGAPVLSGTAGALTEVLDRCLVLGYGSKVPAGWEIVFSATHKRVYRPPAGRRFFYRVDDTAGRSSTAPRVATVQGYESISDIDTGAGPFPNSAAPWLKSITADSVSRSWLIVADAQGLYFSPRPDSSSNICMYAGDGVPLDPADAWFSLVTGGDGDANSTAVTSGRFYIAHAQYPTTIAGIARRYDGTPGAVSMGGYLWRLTTSAAPGSAGFVYPYRGQLLYEAAIVRDPDGPRGWLPGAYAPQHDRPFADLHTYVDGSKILIARRIYANANGQLLIDTGPGFRP